MVVTHKVKSIAIVTFENTLDYLLLFQFKKTRREKGTYLFYISIDLPKEHIYICVFLLLCPGGLLYVKSEKSNSNTNPY